MLSVYFGGEKHSVIAIIPARGGSKRIPRKNLKYLAGRPLIAWTIEMAREMAQIDRLVVSTDDCEVAEAAAAAGAEIICRPKFLAEDSTPAADVIREAIRHFVKDGETKALLLYLQPTSPLRNIKDIEDCLELLMNGYDSAATFTEAKLHPHQAWLINSGKPSLYIAGANPWRCPRQTDQVYQLNGAVYAFHMATFPPQGEDVLYGHCGAVLMPRVRSVDIDDMMGFALAETLKLEQISNLNNTAIN